MKYSALTLSSNQYRIMGEANFYLMENEFNPTLNLDEILKDKGCRLVFIKLGFDDNFKVFSKYSVHKEYVN